MSTLRLASWMACFSSALGSSLTARAADCETPLEEAALPNLTLWTAKSARPGQEVNFYFGRIECCYWILHATDCVEFSVHPAGAAEIETPLPPADPRNFVNPGKLKLAASLEYGETVTLRADVEGGRRIVEAAVHIYTPEANPLVGYWREVSQLPCGGFVRGDVDQDSRLVITDAIQVLGALFLGEPGPGCRDAADANTDGQLDIADPVHVLNFLFTGGPRPRAPFPGCAPAPAGPVLGCETPACEGSEETPAQLIQEMVFEADGTFTVTWTPFELYKDYWGDYQYDVASGAFSLQVLGGNHVPSVLAWGSSFRTETDGSLVLENLWLGSPLGEPVTLRCGHRFR